MIEHLVIEPLSSIWWIGLLSSVAFIFLTIRLLTNKSALTKDSFAKWLSIAFVFTYLISNSIATSARVLVPIILLRTPCDILYSTNGTCLKAAA